MKTASVDKSLSVLTMCDADWASDVNEKMSTSGSAIFLGPNLISWWSCKQQVITRSSIEVEYRSLAQSSTELTWVGSSSIEVVGCPFFSSNSAL